MPVRRAARGGQGGPLGPPARAAAAAAPPGGRPGQRGGPRGAPVRRRLGTAACPPRTHVATGGRPGPAPLPSRGSRLRLGPAPRPPPLPRAPRARCDRVAECGTPRGADSVRRRDSPSITLVARLAASAADARRGVVRLHPEVIDALGLRSWDAVTLTGARVTTALVAPGRRARRGRPPSTTSRCPTPGCPTAPRSWWPRRSVEPARRVLLTGSRLARAALTPETVRLALIGKVVTGGDAVSLLPQDIEPAPGLDVPAARQPRGRRAGQRLDHRAAHRRHRGAGRRGGRAAEHRRRLGGRRRSPATPPCAGRPPRPPGPAPRRGHRRRPSPPGGRAGRARASPVEDLVGNTEAARAARRVAGAEPRPARAAHPPRRLGPARRAGHRARRASAS